MVTAKDNGIQGYEPRIEAENVLAILKEIVSKTSNEASGGASWWKESELTRVYDSLQRYTYILNLVPKSSDTLKALDIGTGFGHLAILIERVFGYAVAGIDCETASFLRKRFDEEGIEFKLCDLTKEPIPFPNSSFGIIVFCDTLHLLPMHPMNVFEEVNRVLKEGGILIVETRNFLNLYNRLKIFFGKARTKWNEKYPHFRQYTINDLVYLLDESGFEIQETLLLDTLNTSMSAIRSNKIKGSLFKFYQILCKIKPCFRDSIMIKARKVANNQ